VTSIEPVESYGRFGARRRRRRRARSGRRRGMYLLPGLFTTGNLFFGFYAIIHSILGEPNSAAWGVVLAAIFDTLDGRVARLAHATSKFGAEYDSLADVVAFGVAPAVLAFAAGDLRLLGRPGWMMMFVYTVCAALRLARFNVHPSRYKGRFEGLPSPAAALMVAATVWFTDFVHQHFVRFGFPEVVVAIGVVAVGLLMVSTFPYRSFKELDLRHSYGTLVFVVIALVLVALEPKVTLFGIVAAYVVSGPSEWIWRRKYGRPLEELPPPSAKDAIHEQH
jgi:CDP-diacylglycerol--serine O-phosphatidyltransferase